MTVGGWDLERLAFGLAIWLPSAAWMVFLQLRVHDGGGIPRTLLQAWLLATLVLGPAVVAWLVQRAPASSRGLLFSVAFYGAAVAFALAVMLVREGRRCRSGYVSYTRNPIWSESFVIAATMRSTSLSEDSA